MTASTFPRADSSATPTTGRFAGLRPLVRKDLAEWRVGVRAAVLVTVTTLILALTAANSWINALIIADLPPGADAPDAPMSMAALDNIASAVGTQFVVIATIFATMSLLVADRDRGTLAWIASKPVGRGDIWVAKWLSGSVAVGLAAGLIPLAITVAIASILYGAPAVGPVLAIALGTLASIVLFVAVTLAASSVVWNQAAVAAIGFAVFVVPVILGGLLPAEVEPFFPTSILGWSMGLAAGSDVGLVTPIAWAVGVAGLVAFGIRRMRRIEL
jgi:ABC-type transport system involved in multi-copper enzyme maturation permease subunit